MPYTIHETTQLGKGAYTNVHLATDEQGKQYAAKVYRTCDSTFIREYVFLKYLWHEHISDPNPSSNVVPKVYDVIVHKGRAAIIMEYGHKLVIRTAEKHLPAMENILEYFEYKGVSVFDVKPPNFVTIDGDIVFVDFNTAELLYPPPRRYAVEVQTVGFHETIKNAIQEIVEAKRSNYWAYGATRAVVKSGVYDHSITDRDIDLYSTLCCDTQPWFKPLKERATFSSSRCICWDEFNPPLVSKKICQQIEDTLHGPDYLVEDESDSLQRAYTHNDAMRDFYHLKGVRMLVYLIINDIRCVTLSDTTAINMAIVIAKTIFGISTYAPLDISIAAITCIDWSRVINNYFAGFDEHTNMDLMMVDAYLTETEVPMFHPSSYNGYHLFYGVTDSSSDHAIKRANVDYMHLPFMEIEGRVVEKVV